MDKVKAEWIIVTAVAAVFFVVSLRPVTTADTLYGIRIGDRILSSGQIPTQEFLSWSASGRPWIAYEWLYQALVSTLNSLGGLDTVAIMPSFGLAIFFILNFVLFRKILERGFLNSLAFSILMCASIYEFFTPRPQVLAYNFLIATASLILLFILKSKNLLILTLPITYLWVNSHGSFIFIPYFFFCFAILGGRKNFKTLIAYGILNLGLSLLPPISYKVYLILWQFFHDSSFLTKAINEWQPLYFYPGYFIYLSIMMALSLFLFTILFFRKKLSKNWILGLPFLIILFLSFQALRHFPLGIISSLIFLNLILPEFSLKQPKLKLAVSFLIITFTITTSFFLIRDKRAFLFSETVYEPLGMVNFLSTYHLSGRMFNHVGHGGYISYYLYPEYQEFIDGRFESYRCCELRDIWSLVDTKKSSSEDFKTTMNAFLDKYQFSYLLIPIESYNPLQFSATERMGSILDNDPNWKLIYFDDNTRILLKNDGKNTQVWKELGMSVITPFQLTQFKKGQEEQALKEYQRQIDLQDSGSARSGLGQVYFSLDQLDKAREQFSKAIGLNPRLGRAHLGLGKISLKENQSGEAITELTKATQISPFLGEAYLLLGQIYLGQGDKLKAKTILEQGLTQNIDLQSRQKIVETESKL